MGYEHIQSLLAEEVDKATKVPDNKRVEVLISLTRKATEANEKGLFAVQERAGRKYALTIPDLLERTYQLLSLVRDPLASEQEAYEKRGYVFFPIEAKTFLEVVLEKPTNFQDRQLEFINNCPYQDLITVAPSRSVLVGFNPKKLFLPNSFNQPLVAQLEKTKETSSWEIEIRRFPDVYALMLPATFYAQADIAYLQKTGVPLFRDRFARALDTTSIDQVTSKVQVASVGRFKLGDPLQVNEWVAEYGDEFSGAACGLVFLDKV